MWDYEDIEETAPAWHRTVAVVIGIALVLLGALLAR